jgi:hypothetical protein
MTRAERRRRRQSEDRGYVDDVIADGQIVRTPMMLADSATLHATRFHYGKGYLRDANSGHIVDARGERISDPTKEGPPFAWPQQTSNIVPAFNNKIGSKCICESGEAGTLQPHPVIASSLYCVPNGKDSATVTDATSAYFAMKDSLSSEWTRHQPKQLHDCGCHGRDQAGTVGFINTHQVQWPQGQHEGQECSVNGSPGHIVRGVCVPDRNGKDADIVAPMGTYAVGGPWPEGCSCDLGNGEYGVLVKVGDRLVCRKRDFGNGDATPDHEAIRDHAYWESVRAAEQAWRSW